MSIKIVIFVLGHFYTQRPEQFIFKILNYFQFQSGSPSVTSLREGIVPVLKVLCNLAMGHRMIRKYYKEIVLPPLRDLNQRPEVGNSIRSRLCRLLTSPESQVSNMVAEFLFILCKEDGKYFTFTFDRSITITFHIFMQSNCI